jgi:putative transposase
VWWLRLGIQIERIKPGHPEQNGRHERMHLTLKKETTGGAKTSCSNKQSSTTLSIAITMSVHIKRST